MSNMDFDAIESNKFWKEIIRYFISGIVAITIAICLYYTVEARNMMEAGYEYRRVHVSTRQVANYQYEWVKIGSEEHKESKTFTVPERTNND